MRSLVNRSLFFSAIAVAVACHSAPPPPVAAPVPLSDSATSALQWVQGHAQQFSIADSIPSSTERTHLVALVGNAQIIGVSELTEGTRELPMIIRHLVQSLADSAGLRGLAIQGPMAEALEVDRYVRTGAGDPRRLLQAMGSWRWENREMLAVVAELRNWNRAHADKQIGFYGFEIPSAAHAVNVVTGLPDSVAGASLKAWLVREYGCVAMSEGAHWGLEGRASDSTFWNRCGTVANAGVDSIVALRARVGAGPAGADVAYAEQMARLIQHHVTLSLRHTNRHDSNAEHLLYLANRLGPNAKLLAWGGDVEMGRLTLDKVTVQTGVPLGQRLGARYRPIGFVFGDGIVRTRRASSGRGGAPAGLSDVMIRPPLQNTYEDVLMRPPMAAYWLDVRALPTDIGGAWLRGPRNARLVTDLYIPDAPELTETPVELPAFFDALVYVRHVTAARQ